MEDTSKRNYQKTQSATGKKDDGNGTGRRSRRKKKEKVQRMGVHSKCEGYKREKIIRATKDSKKGKTF